VTKPTPPIVGFQVNQYIIKLTNYLLDRQLKHLEQAFLNEGGMRERMTNARRVARDKKRQDDLP
jgi:four helix bundle suffix protein